MSEIIMCHISLSRSGAPYYCHNGHPSTSTEVPGLYRCNYWRYLFNGEICIDVVNRLFP